MGLLGILVALGTADLAGIGKSVGHFASYGQEILRRMEMNPFRRHANIPGHVDGR